MFNPESWARSDFFDFELEPDEILVDPATGQAIPCGAIKAHQRLSGCALLGRQTCRLTGYKFYAIAKGKVPEGEAFCN